MGQKSQAKGERGAKMDLKSFCPGFLNEIGIDKIIHTPANFNQSTEKWWRLIQPTCTFL